MQSLLGDLINKHKDFGILDFDQLEFGNSKFRVFLKIGFLEFDRSKVIRPNSFLYSDSQSLFFRS